MNAGVDAPIDLAALCTALEATPDAMRAAFLARLHELGRGTPVNGEASTLTPCTDARDDAWWAGWYDRLIGILRVDLGDPLCVPRVVDIVRHGDAAGHGVASHRRGIAAFGWACRDVLPSFAPPAALAAIDARGAMIARVWSRLHPA